MQEIDENLEVHRREKDANGFYTVTSYSDLLIFRAQSQSRT